MSPLEKACRAHRMKPRSAAGWKKLAEILAAEIYSPRERGRPRKWSPEDYGALADDYVAIAAKTELGLSMASGVAVLRRQKGSEWSKFSAHYLRRQLSKALKDF